MQAHANSKEYKNFQGSQAVLCATTQEIDFLNSLAEWATSEPTDHLPSLLAHFLLHYQSPHTRRNYWLDIQDFLHFAEHNLGCRLEKVSQITEKLILLWQEQLRQKHCEHQGAKRRIVQTSIARKLSTLSSFLEFAVKRRILVQNPAKLVRRPRVKRESKTNAFTVQEMQAMLHYLSQKRAEYSSQPQSRFFRSYALQYAVIYTLFSVGMRVDELCELRIGDLEITPEYARLHMTAKGEESHSPIIHDQTRDVLLEYITLCRSGASTNDYLFVRAQKTTRTTKLTQRAVYNFIVKTAKAVGIQKKVSPHSCRASLATLLHNANVPIGQIQALLNHKQITTTALYIKKAEELRESAARKIHILDPNLADLVNLAITENHGTQKTSQTYHQQ